MSKFIEALRANDTGRRFAIHPRLTLHDSASPAIRSITAVPVYELIAQWHVRAHCHPHELLETQRRAKSRMAHDIYGDLIGLMHDFVAAAYDGDMAKLKEIEQELMLEMTP